MTREPCRSSVHFSASIVAPLVQNTRILHIEKPLDRKSTFSVRNIGAELPPSKILPRSRGKVCHLVMTKLLEQAVETVRGLPPEMQDDLARVLLQLAGEDQPVLQLSAEEEASFGESLAQADRGEFATDEQVRAIWAKHDL